MRVFAATKNAGKLRELQAIFAPLGWEIVADPEYVDPPEGEKSYAENAALKARALFAQRRERGDTGAVLGDDSGLEVVALDGRPGVLSARYGGDSATWPQRRAKLLAEVAAAGRADRTARFVCALCCIESGGGELNVIADVVGRIARTERGDGGFSYDAVFEYGGATFAELNEREKNAISHRARAARALLDAWERRRAS